ncbi:MepB family protein [Leifsonia xyli]|uniref:MepB family protein n=1 Tax=Leifsonia xyli TaxID=1575 RepID=UPI003D666201
MGDGTESGLHPDVVRAARALGVPAAALRAEPDNAAYGAAVCADGGGGHVVRFRFARVTPRKTGLFVAVWCRGANGVTEPFDAAAQDRLVIVVRQGIHFGLFDLPAAVLDERGIVSVAGAGGKRGFRVYPPWSVTASTQAAATQRWQTPHFLNIA